MKVLRIQRDEVDAQTVILTPHGPIAAQWANLLERECQHWSRSGFRVVLQISEVVFIGRYGLEVLGRLRRAGVRIMDRSPMFSSVSQRIHTRF
jgi:anti-anti-sigma regulatory factor